MGQIKNEALLKKIALKIKELRESKGVTHETFYNDTNIHIGRIEQGKTNITVSTLKELLDYFGVSLGEFFASF